MTDGDKKREKAEDESSPKGKEGSEEEPKPKSPKWPWIVGSAIVLAFVAVVLVVIYSPKPNPWTDDAHVAVHYATVAPRVSGQVVSVVVGDNQVVEAGQLLVQLDPRDYQSAVDQAEATLARDTAQVINAGANVARQPALIAEKQAAVQSAQAALDFSRLNRTRYDNLATTGAGTRQQQQQANSDTRQNEASLNQAKAALEATQRQLQVLNAQKTSSEGTVKSDEAQLEQARLNLSYTRIVAPLDGMVSAKTVQVGNYLSAGTTMMTLVPLDQVYVEANYREVALRHILSGQQVTIHVDAYDIDLDGVVDSVPPASNATFAPIAPNNATGNFTKIVQRLPVKILVSPGQPLARLLRVGFSVETTVHTGLADVTRDPNRTTSRVTVR